MRTWIIAAIVAGALSAPGLAAQAAGETLAIDLSNFKYSPATLQMRRGETYALTLHNRSRGGHSFSASGFFAAAEVAGPDKARLKDGEVEVPGRGEVTLSVTPRQAGTYPFHCDHPLHSLLGMRGRIVVD